MKSILLKLKYYLQKRMFTIADFAVGLATFYPLVAFMVNPAFQLSRISFLGLLSFYYICSFKFLAGYGKKYHKFIQKMDVFFSNPFLDFTMRTIISFGIFISIVQAATVTTLLIATLLSGLIGVLIFPKIRKSLPLSLDKFSPLGSVYFENLYKNMDFASFLKKNDLHKGIQDAAKYHQEEDFSKLLFKVSAAVFGEPESPFRNIEIINELIKLGANVNIELDGQSLLKQIIRVASMRTYFSEMFTELEMDKTIIRYLVENGADINQKTVGWTARGSVPECSLLYINVLHSKTPEIFKLLLDLGIDMSKRDPISWVNLELARKLQNENWRKVMVDHYQQLEPLKTEAKSLKYLVSLKLYHHEKTKPINSRNRFLLSQEEQKKLDPTKPATCLPNEMINYYLNTSARKRDLNNLKFYSRMIENEPQLAEYFSKEKLFSL